MENAQHFLIRRKVHLVSGIKKTHHYKENLLQEKSYGPLMALAISVSFTSFLYILFLFYLPFGLLQTQSLLPQPSSPRSSFALCAFLPPIDELLLDYDYSRRFVLVLASWFLLFAVC